MTTNRGTKAIQARKEKLNLGKERISRTADKRGKEMFLNIGSCNMKMPASRPGVTGRHVWLAKAVPECPKGPKPYLI
jgi:hypothetical protein